MKVIGMKPITYKCSCCNDFVTTEKEYGSYPYKLTGPHKLSVTCRNVKIKDMYGEEIEITPLEEAAYSIIMGIQIATPDYMKNPKAQMVVRAGLDWFREYHAKTYMRLLD